MDIRDIEHLAALARLELGEEEKRTLVKDIGEILMFVKQVQDVPMAPSADERVGIPYNAMREDSEPHAPGIYTDALLGEAPLREGDFVKVKKIL